MAPYFPGNQWVFIAALIIAGLIWGGYLRGGRLTSHECSPARDSRRQLLFHSFSTSENRIPEIYLNNKYPKCPFCLNLDRRYDKATLVTHDVLSQMRIS